MIRLRHFIPLAISLMALLAVISSCQRSHNASAVKSPRLAFITNGVASFWVIGKAGALAAAKDFKVDVSVHMPAEGIADQKRIVEDLLTRGVDGIAISMIDSQNQTGLIASAAQHTKVITHDSDAPNSPRLAYVGMDNYLAGRLAGELAKEALPEGGKIMFLIGRLEQDNARRRRQGALDEILGRSLDQDRYDEPGKDLSNGKYTIVGTLTDQFDRAKAKANCEDSLARYPDLGMMIGLFAYNSPLCLEALRQAGKLNQVKVVAFDEDPETLQAIRDGYCYGTVVQNPYRYGYESIRILAGLARGDNSVLPPNGFFDIPARKIKRDNLTPFWDDLNSKLNNT